MIAQRLPVAERLVESLAVLVLRRVRIVVHRLSGEEFTRGGGSIAVPSSIGWVELFAQIMRSKFMPERRSARLPATRRRRTRFSRSEDGDATFISTGIPVVSALAFRAPRTRTSSVLL
jgi:hypothetical protein